MQLGMDTLAVLSTQPQGKFETNGEYPVGIDRLKAALTRLQEENAALQLIKAQVVLDLGRKIDALLDLAYDDLTRDLTKDQVKK
jgi:hypothetical protein